MIWFCIVCIYSFFRPVWGGIHIIHIFWFIFKNVLYILCKTGNWYIPADYYSVTSHSDVNSCHCHMLVLKQNDSTELKYINQTTCHINNWSWCCPHCVCVCDSESEQGSLSVLKCSTSVSKYEAVTAHPDGGASDASCPCSTTDNCSPPDDCFSPRL